MAKISAVLKNDTKVVTGLVRLSYAHIFEPKGINGGDPKYSVSLIIPKSDKQMIKVIEQAIESAKELGKAKWGGKIPANIKLPLRDGDEERPDDDAYANSYFVNTSSNTAPKVVGTEKDKKTGKAIELGSDDVYSGCYCRVSVNFYPFNVNGNKGVACGLNSIQKIEDGEPLGGSGGSAEDDFDFEEVDADDYFLA